MGQEKRTFSHNDINIFQPNEIKPDENGVTRGMMYPAPPVPDGTGIEWYAEKDVYVVMSNCPYADQALPLPEAKPNPMYIIVYETGIAPETDAGSTVGPIRLLRTSCNDTSAQAGFLQEDVSCTGSDL